MSNDFKEAVGLGRSRAKRKLPSLITRYKVPKRIADNFKKDLMAMVEDGITAALARVGLRPPDAPPIPGPVRDPLAEARSKTRAEARAAGKAAGHLKAMRIEPDPEPTPDESKPEPEGSETKPEPPRGNPLKRETF